MRKENLEGGDETIHPHTDCGDFARDLRRSMTSGAAAEELQKLRLGFGTKVVSPMIANILIPEYLGYYREEGLTLEFFPLGPNSVVIEQIASKRIEFATGIPTVQLPIVAKGETLPTINFFEFTYPFKYGLAIIRRARSMAFADLKGKTVGVSSLGLTDYPIFKFILKRNGIDPDKDVNILAVGEGVVGGQALQARRGRGAVQLRHAVRPDRGGRHRHALRDAAEERAEHRRLLPGDTARDAAGDPQIGRSASAAA